MQDDRQPYLLPVDVPGDDVERVIRNSIGLDSLLKRLDGKAELTVALFDARRETPTLTTCDLLPEESLHQGKMLSMQTVI